MFFSLQVVVPSALFCSVNLCLITGVGESESSVQVGRLMGGPAPNGRRCAPRQLRRRCRQQQIVAKCVWRAVVGRPLSGVVQPRLGWGGVPACKVSVTCADHAISTKSPTGRCHRPFLLSLSLSACVRLSRLNNCQLDSTNLFKLWFFFF